MDVVELKAKYCIDKFTPNVAPVDKAVEAKAKVAIAKAGREIGLTPRLGSWNRDHKMAHAQAFATIAGKKATITIHYDVDDESVSIQVSTADGKHLFFDNVAQYKAWVKKNGGANGRKLDSDKRKK